MALKNNEENWNLVIWQKCKKIWLQIVLTNLQFAILSVSKGDCLCILIKDSIMHGLFSKWLQPTTDTRYNRGPLIKKKATLNIFLNLIIVQFQSFQYHQHQGKSSTFDDSFLISTGLSTTYIWIRPFLQAYDINQWLNSKEARCKATQWHA